jgi:hypothetical protein
MQSLLKKNGLPTEITQENISELIEKTKNDLEIQLFIKKFLEYTE